ncbi:DUF5134 domain-containing protein [Streptacidiphilus sp. PB12-B1b]|uniref:DUF5134 domain-containing protein n=1 Tax=Streptacidiphilus sp. PB12-B1b TaxID=2705012 RepID=UPI0015F9E5D8|nr:DUF5134 domain-containing protein [Streptacidiphilus sp. PB12-B1b]QMU74736.1 DUF5134 domain-containing protein [Streptacidiphilus sp. PB12-B1b]
MNSPSWLSDSLAAIMLATAAYCAGRLVVSRLWHRRVEHDVDAVHLVMGVAMAGMLVPRLNPLGDTVWETVFALTSLWFAIRVILARRAAQVDRRAIGHHLAHLVLSGAMLYMYLAQSSATGGSASSGGMGGGMGGSIAGGARYPTLALVLALVLFGYAVSVLDRTTPLPTQAQRNTEPGHRSGVTGDGRAERVADVPETAGPQTAVGENCGSPVHRTVRGLLAPRSANCCDIVMSVTMAYLLILML